jgi:transglutaminase-like putative cysteine protease
MQAVWKAEDEVYHLIYINTTTAFGPHIVQRMRLPAEVLDQSSGNCVELAILYASVAEALGLEAAIVRIPGHAYTAIRTDQEHAKYYFIETTLIGRATFSEAINKGSQEWDDAKPHFDANEEGYAWVTIPDVRKKGILPIPWH